VARGKDPQGRVTLRARRESGSIVIEVEDDGGGLDFARIRETAAARGIDPARLRETDLKELIFSSGFSTAAAVTDLSGRGVGMEVVRRNAEILRGTIGVESRPGAGTTVSVRVPLTLAIIDGFSVGAGDETYIVPLDTVVECIELPPDTDDRSATCGVVNVRGEALPFLRLRDLFGLPGEGRGRENVVVVRQEQQLIGIAVDALHGQSQAVIKPLGKTFKGLVGVAGATILGSGRVALILDVAAVTREAMKRQTARQLQAEAEATS
jgi:two-component system chemotaxis sensor kinase CheA